MYFISRKLKKIKIWKQVFDTSEYYGNTLQQWSGKKYELAPRSIAVFGECTGT